jgi:hypothetical protein
MRCIACGNAALVKGRLTMSDSSKVSFTPSDDPKLKQIFGMGGRPVRVYGCTRCSNLQLAVEFSEEDLERYLSFEGEPERSAVADSTGPSDADR